MRAVDIILLGSLLIAPVISQDIGGSGNNDKDDIRPCVVVVPFENGDRTSEGIPVPLQANVNQNERVSYECVEGFELRAEGSPVRAPYVRTCIKVNNDLQLVFDRPPPVCERISCPPPPIPENGRRQGNSFMYEDTVTFTCDENFRLSGTRRRTCRADGTFSGSEVTCIAQTCNDPGQVEFASRNLQGLFIGQTASYQCDPGYELKGQQTLTCQSDLQWSHPLPSCQPVACCRLEAPINGQISGNDNALGSTTRFRCDSGFQLMGSEERRCQTDGTWSGTHPQCVPIMCPIPRPIANGGFTGNGFGVSDSVDFYCINGFQLSGAPKLTCQEDGTWDLPLPFCEVINCGNPGMPENGARNGDNFTYTAHAMFSCNDGYRLFGSPVRFCLADGTWSGEPAACNLATCGDPGTPINGGRTLSGTANGDTVSWTCDSGFRLVGEESAVCLPSGRWSRPTPLCRRVVCLEPLAPENGARLGEDFSVGATVAFTCDVGYMRRGPQSIDCLATGLWNQPPPVCVPLRCGDPGSPENGYRQQDGNVLNSRTEFFCNPGYQLVGPRMRTCVSAPSGIDALMWDQSVPRCAPIDCGDPGTPEKGSRQGEDFSLMSTVGFQCDTGYVLRGPISILCLPNGQWSQPIPSCEPIRCPTPSTVMNGRIVSFGQNFMDTAVWECDAGYVLRGRPSAVCQANGQWTNPPPVCIIGTCPDPGTPFNGYRFMETATIGSTVKYFCNPGYSISGPESRVCQSDGTWDNRVPDCEPINCGDPGTPNNGAKIGTDYTFASTVSFTCDSGYMRSGRDLITCLANGSWSHPIPKCNEINCSPPAEPINGRTEYSSTSFGAQANYVCNDGYNLEGPRRAVCELNGQWSERPPLCRKITCPDPGTPVNGGRALEGLEYQDTVIFSCDTGYNMQNDPRGPVVCLATGMWSHPTPTCEPVICPDPGSPLQGAVISSGIRTSDTYVYRDTVAWQCDEGYTLVGSPAATCQADGSWSSNTPICTPVLCLEPAAPINGAKFVEGLSLGQAVRFTCNEGYTMIGEPSTTCLPSGSWSTPTPLCRPNECPPVSTPRNGDMNMTNTQFMGVAAFSCLEGFELKGETKLTCLADGRWSSQPPLCEELFCEDPGVPENGQRLTNDLSIGGMLRYQCNVGFTRNGEEVLTCLPDLVHDNPVPSCDPDCLLGEWTNWGACSMTCGDGVQERTRDIIQAPAGSGKACEPQREQQSCNLKPCVICENIYNLGDLVSRIQQTALIPVTDVVIVVDESKSMATEHQWLPDMVRALERILNEVGIGRAAPAPRSQRNLYALVGYGKRAPGYLAHRFASACPGQNEFLFPIECYESANSQLVEDTLGSVEDGYEAMDFALDNIPYRRGAGIAHNMILVSDEDRDIKTPITRAQIKAKMEQNDFVLNVVIDNRYFDRNGGQLLGVDNRRTGFRSTPGGGYQEVVPTTIGQGYASTKIDYTDLALELRGAAWDINLLRTGDASTSFTNAFTQVKTSEIKRQTDRCSDCECVAAPAVEGGGEIRCVESTDQDRCSCKAQEGNYIAFNNTCPGAKPKVDCLVSSWSAFGPCSSTCGRGLSTRTRTVIQKPVSGGASCPSLEQNQLCNLGPCEGDGCTDPGAPAGGSASLVGATSYPSQPGSLVQFVCDEGLDLVGTDFTVCNIDLTWSNPVPTCEQKCIPSSTTTRLETATQNVGSDVVLVVDQSNSMGNEIQWLKDIIPQLDAELLKNQVGTDPSCPNRYAVVGFGRAIPGHLATLYTPRVGGEMFPIGQYNDAVRNLVEDGAGRFEDGFQAMDFALRTLPLRTSTSQCQISKNMILLTDEDRDVADGYEGLTRPVMQDRLARANFKLNAIVDNAFTVGGVRGIGRISNRGFGSPSFGSGTCYTSSSSVSSQNGYGNTKAMYTDMALALGGGAWDILQLRDPSIRSAMTCAMLDVKVTEIASEVTRCYICSCSQFSQRTCRLSTASEEPECLCMNNNRQWRNGVCLPAGTQPPTRSPQPVTTPSSPIECILSDWTAWSPCELRNSLATCGPGSQSRTRQPENTAPDCPDLNHARGCEVLCEDLPRCEEVGQALYEDNTGNVTTAADVIIVIDESDSMDTEHAWLPGMVESLEAELKFAGIGTSGSLQNLYALVGFGRSGEGARARTHKFGSAEFFTAAQYPFVNDQLEADLEGNVEDGYQAIKHALDTLPFRRSPSVALNIILVTDEDRDTLPEATGITRDVIKFRILQEGAVLNVVVDNSFQALNGTAALGVDSFGTAYLAVGTSGIPTKTNVQLGSGYSRTRRSYTELALETGGAAWDINLIRRGGQFIEASFTAAFIRVKTAEVKQRVAVCRRCDCSLDLQWICRADPDQDQCRCRAKGEEGSEETRECLLIALDLPQCPGAPIVGLPIPCPFECTSNANCSQGETCCRQGCSSTCEDEFECGPDEVTYSNSPGTVDVATDIVMVVDESRSMEMEHQWLKTMASDLEVSLRRANIGSGALRNHYHLVGFGKREPNQEAHTFNHLGKLAVTSEEVNFLLNQLVADPRGYVEDGYQATIFALDELPIRRSNDRVNLNLILVSDEDRDGVNQTIRQTLTTAHVLRRLQQEQATLNVVVDQSFSTSQARGGEVIGMDSQRVAFLTRRNGGFTRTSIGTRVGTGYANTFPSYTKLAWDVGGASWDINILREGRNSAASFTAAFTNVKTEEVVGQFTTCQRCTCTFSRFWTCQPDPIQERCQCSVRGKRWSNELNLCVG